MNHVKDRVIILSRRDFGEKDRILVVLGLDHGKHTLLAKSTRSAKSKLAGSVELFCESNVQFVQGKGSMHTLTGARLHKSYTSISSDIDRTMLAYEFLKIIDKVVEEGHGQEYYEVLAGALLALDKDKSTDLIKAWFGVRILGESGHLPALKNGPKGNRLEEATAFTYDFDTHCFCPKENGKYQVEHVKLLRVLATARQVPEVKADVQILQQTAQLVEQLVQLQLY